MSLSIQGLWSLKSWMQLDANGASQPYSSQPIGGFLHYGSDGQMAVSIYEQEAAKILSSYAGPYELIDHEVLHRPLAGHSPQGIQEAKRRYLRREGPTLWMETDWLPGAEPARRYRLEWTQLGAGSVDA